MNYNNRFRFNMMKINRLKINMKVKKVYICLIMQG